MRKRRWAVPVGAALDVINTEAGVISKMNKHRLHSEIWFWWCGGWGMARPQTCPHSAKRGSDGFCGGGSV